MYIYVCLYTPQSLSISIDSLWFIWFWVAVMNRSHICLLQLCGNLWTQSTNQNGFQVETRVPQVFGLIPAILGERVDVWEECKGKSLSFEHVGRRYLSLHRSRSVHRFGDFEWNEEDRCEGECSEIQEIVSTSKKGQVGQEGILLTTLEAVLPLVVFAKARLYTSTLSWYVVSRLRNLLNTVHARR